MFLVSIQFADKRENWVCSLGFTERKGKNRCKMGRQEGAKPALSISLRSIAPYMSLITTLLIASEIAAPCLLFLRCSQVLPTLSYAAALHGFDRWFAASLAVISTFWTLLLLCLHPVLSTVWPNSGFWTISGISMCPLLWTIGVFDQEQGARFLRQGQVHEVLSFTCFLLLSTWTVFAVEATARLSLSARERCWLGRLQRLLYMALGLGLLAAIESKLAYSVYAGSLWGENIEAVIEWTALLATALIPYVWAQAVPDIHLELSFSSPQE